MSVPSMPPGQRPQRPLPPTPHKSSKQVEKILEGEMPPEIVGDREVPEQRYASKTFKKKMESQVEKSTDNIKSLGKSAKKSMLNAYKKGVEKVSKNKEPRQINIQHPETEVIQGKPVTELDGKIIIDPRGAHIVLRGMPPDQEIL